MRNGVHCLILRSCSAHRAATSRLGANDRLRASSQRGERRKRKRESVHMEQPNSLPMKLIFAGGAVTNAATTTIPCATAKFRQSRTCVCAWRSLPKSHKSEIVTRLCRRGQNDSLARRTLECLLSSNDRSAETTKTAENYKKNQSRDRSALALRTASDSGNNPVHVVFTVRIEQMEGSSE
jgi:hypothetical protein